MSAEPECPFAWIVGVGEADVEGEVIEAMRVHLPAAYGVEAFGRLPVALLDLRAQAAGPGADGIGAEMLEPAVLELPDLELGFFLENPDEDRRIPASCP